MFTNENEGISLICVHSTTEEISVVCFVYSTKRCQQNLVGNCFWSKQLVTYWYDRNSRIDSWASSKVEGTGGMPILRARFNDLSIETYDISALGYL